MIQDIVLTVLGLVLGVLTCMWKDGYSVSDLWRLMFCKKGCCDGV